MDFGMYVFYGVLLEEFCLHVFCFFLHLHGVGLHTHRGELSFMCVLSVSAK